jgi:hypothetical protein
MKVWRSAVTPDVEASTPSARSTLCILASRLAAAFADFSSADSPCKHRVADAWRSTLPAACAAGHESAAANAATNLSPSAAAGSSLPKDSPVSHAGKRLALGTASCFTLTHIEQHPTCRVSMTAVAAASRMTAVAAAAAASSGAESRAGSECPSGSSSASCPSSRISSSSRFSCSSFFSYCFARSLLQREEMMLKNLQLPPAAPASSRCFARSRLQQMKQGGNCFGYACNGMRCCMEAWWQ